MAVDKAKARELAREAVAFLPDTVALFRAVLRDERLPRRVKVEVGAAVAYLLMPIDVIPDFVPALGALDDVAVASWALRRLLLGAGEGVLREHWRGSPRGLEILMQVAAAGLRPRQLIGALAFGGLVGGRGARNDRVVEGEIVDER